MEEVIREPEGLSLENMRPVLCALRVKIDGFLQKYNTMSGRQLAEQRYQRFRKM